MKHRASVAVIFALALVACVLLGGCQDILAPPAEPTPFPTGEPRPGLRAAFAYLNAVRADPGAYDEQIVAAYNARWKRNVTMDLSDVEPRPALLWNDILASVAQAKCDDMVARNYYGHVDPDGEGINIKMHRAGYLLPAGLVSRAHANAFESLRWARRTSSRAIPKPSAPELSIRAVEDIQALIVDDFAPSLGHRYHLLGIGDWHRWHKDIGIGQSLDRRGNSQTRYLCVVIAHQPPP